MRMDLSRLLAFFAMAAGFILWGLGILFTIRVFQRTRARAKDLEGSSSMPLLPFPALLLHLVPPLVVGGLIAYGVQTGREGLNALYAVACAFVIIQFVVGGIFGFGRTLFAVGCTAIFVFVEVGIAVVIFLATAG